MLSASLIRSRPDDALTSGLVIGELATPRGATSAKN
jgi:hypothetical protein